MQKVAIFNANAIVHPLAGICSDRRLRRQLGRASQSMRNPAAMAESAQAAARRARLLALRCLDGRAMPRPSRRPSTWAGCLRPGAGFVNCGASAGVEHGGPFSRRVGSKGNAMPPRYKGSAAK